MRRLSLMPVLIVLVAAGTAVALSAAVATAGSPSSGGTSPGAGGTTTTTTTGTSPGKPAGKVKAVTISAAPNPGTAGTPIVISGRVQARNHGGVLVTLWRMFPRDRRF